MSTNPTALDQYLSAPPHWVVKKLKFVASVQNSNVDKHIHDNEIPVSLCNYVDVYYNDRITPELDFMQGSVSEPELEKFQLKKGQVILTKDSESWDDIGIPAYVSEDMPEVVCGYHLSLIKPNDIELDGSYLGWLAISDALNDQFKLAANGVTRFGLPLYSICNALILLPSVPEQQAIARFLDERMAKIDAFLAKVGVNKLKKDSLKGTLVDLTLEYRQALITSAVTGKINVV
ncbi:MAG: restriction endonuclease subunit S [Nitrospinae bacterium]|nr:restriction endonuclease subunit S [Nitrospinota bacterium]